MTVPPYGVAVYRPDLAVRLIYLPLTTRQRVRRAASAGYSVTLLASAALSWLYALACLFRMVAP